MIPVIALLGRPNVGKSTLFNRLTRSRQALVADFPGLTRDRQYGAGTLGDRPFIVIDTGGLDEAADGIGRIMSEQALLALAEADLALLLVDAKAGLMPGDEQIVELLRKRRKTPTLAVNKIDGMDADLAQSGFYGLGCEAVYGIAASQGRGVAKMLQGLLAKFPAPDPAAEQKADAAIKIAIAGRPNVGKSTLVNRLLGEDRVIVFDQPGTTRDSIYIPYQRDGNDYVLIDTAGIRRRGKTREAVEKFSVVKALQAIRDANVVILLLDAREGVVEQDLHLLSYILEAGRALVIALNKWDGMNAEAKEEARKTIERRMGFIDFAKVHFISALHGDGVGDIYVSIDKAFASASKKLDTSRLTRLLERLTAAHPPPLIKGRRIKLRYAHPGGANPPRIVIHGRQTSKVPAHYVRYLEKGFRKFLELEGTPVRIELRSGDNPFGKG